MNRVLTMAAWLRVAVSPHEVAEHLRRIDAENTGRALYELTTKPMESNHERRQDRR